MEPGVWPGVWIVLQAQVADLDHLVVGDHEVVARQHLGVFGRDARRRSPRRASAVTAWMWSKWPCVVSTRRTPVARETSSSSSCSLAASMITASPLPLHAQHEHVVLERPDDHLLDAHVGRLVVRQAGHDHAPRLQP